MRQASFVNHRRADIDHLVDVIPQHAPEHVLMKHDVFRQDVSRKSVEPANAIDQRRGLDDSVNTASYFVDERHIGQVAADELVVAISLDLAITRKIVYATNIVTTLQ